MRAAIVPMFPSRQIMPIAVSAMPSSALELPVFAG